MPHVGAASGGEDLASSDEIKVFKDEGDEEENRSSENLTDLKSSLVTEGEEEKSSEVQGTNDYSSTKNPEICRPDSASHSGKTFELLSPHSTPIGYVVSPYPHPHNGSLGPMPMGGKVPMVPPHSGSPLPFMVYNGEPFAQPPPAHMGIPTVAIDPKTGIPRPPVYHIGPPGQYPSVFSPDFTHQLQWHTPALYPPTSAGFRSAYSAALPVTSASLPRFGSPPALISPYPPGISHPALISAKHELSPHHPNHSCMMPYYRTLPEYPGEQKYNPSAKPATPISHGSSNCNSSSSSSGSSSNATAEKKVHIKKPLNAFMLYMKEMRAKVVAECTLKESAAINQILGRRWHSLTREEQAKYYEMARKERQLHMQLYPGWSARDNYALQVKKKKRKKDRNQDGDGNNLKKCRARFGLDQQSSWCKPCRRKKKCIRYLDSNDSGEPESEDNLGSAGSVEAPTPESPDTDHSLDPHGLDPKTPSPPSPLETKPILSHDGSILLPPPPLQSRIHHQPHHSLYHHHPLSVHHLIQPHFGRLTERFQQDSAAPSHMLTVT